MNEISAKKPIGLFQGNFMADIDLNHTHLTSFLGAYVPGQ